MDSVAETTLQVHSIFDTISGEIGCVFPQGTVCTLVRLQGCNLSCSYCDIKESQNLDKGKKTTIEEVKIATLLSSNILLTGGEPLLQPNIETLVLYWLNKGKQVQIETNGTLPPFKSTHPNLGYVVDCKSDLKHPVSFAKTWQNTNHLFKFVISLSDIVTTAGNIKSLADSGYAGLFAISPIDADTTKVNEMIDLLGYLLPLNLWYRVVISIQVHKICGWR